MVCHIDAAICRQSRVKNLSLPASDFMVQCNGNPCKEVLSPEGAHFTLSHRAILWVQESVIFPVRSQINPFPSKFVKGFFPTIGLLCHTWTPLLLDCPVQVHEKHPFSHSDNFEGQLYIMQWQGKNGLTFPPLILIKMWSSGLHSTQADCVISTAVEALNFHPQDEREWEVIPSHFIQT